MVIISPKMPNTPNSRRKKVVNDHSSKPWTKRSTWQDTEDDDISDRRDHALDVAAMLVQIASCDTYGITDKTVQELMPLIRTFAGYSNDHIQYHLCVDICKYVDADTLITINRWCVYYVVYSIYKQQYDRRRGHVPYMVDDALIHRSAEQFIQNCEYDGTFNKLSERQIISKIAEEMHYVDRCEEELMYELHYGYDPDIW